MALALFYLVHPKRWLPVALVSAVGLLGVAHAFEYFGHLAPCELCYAQRDVYWLAAGCALLGFSLSRPDGSLQSRNLKAARWACAILALLFLAETGVAAYHAGVEWKWWPGPTTCTGRGVSRITAADLAAVLKGQHHRVVKCDEAAWRFLGLSMAGWNVLIAAKLTSLSLVAFLRKP